jgi:hypothetical protein
VHLCVPIDDPGRKGAAVSCPDLDDDLGPLPCGQEPQAGQGMQVLVVVAIEAWVFVKALI